MNRKLRGCFFLSNQRTVKSFQAESFAASSNQSLKTTTPRRLIDFFLALNIFQRFLLRKMAGPKMTYGHKLAKDFSPSIKISDGISIPVISSIKELLHFGTGYCSILSTGLVGWILF